MELKSLDCYVDMDPTQDSDQGVDNPGSVYDFDEDQDSGRDEDGDNGLEQQPLISRVTDLAFSGATYDRRAAARQMLETFKQVFELEKDSVESVLLLIDKLVRDEEQNIRSVMMEQIPDIALYCHVVGPHLDFVVTHHILPHIVHLLSDAFSQVRKSAQNGLLQLVERGVISPSEVEGHIFPVLLPYTDYRAQDDVRAEVAGFMSKLCQLAGKEITVSKYLKKYCLLCDDPSVQVRRVAAASMEDMFPIVGAFLAENVLLPRFLILCDDDVWGVRRACAEVFPIVSSCCNLEVRKTYLAKAFLALLEDSSVWVKLSASQTLGPFIATYHVDDDAVAVKVVPPTENEKLFVEDLKATYENASTETGEANNSKVEESGEFDAEPQTFSFEETFPDETEGELDSSGEGDSSGDGDFLDSSFIDFDEQADSETQERETPMDCSEDEDKNSKLMDSQSEDQDLSVEERRSKSSGNINKDKSSHQNPVELNTQTQPTERSEDEKLIVKMTGDSYNTWQYWRLPLPDLEFTNANLIAAGSTSDITNQNNVETELNGNNLSCSNPDIVQLSVNNKSGVPPPEIVVVQENEISSSSNTNKSSPETRFKIVKDDEKVKEESDSSSGSSNINEVPVSVAPSFVHRSYNNLFSVSNSDRPREMESYASKLFYGSSDSGYNLSPDEMPYIVKAHGPSGDQGRLLPTLNKIYSVDSQDVVPPQLLAHYIKLAVAENKRMETTMDNDRSSFCSYNFPAVVVTLGPENWSILRDCFETLACQSHWKIRYTLAASLHEIASILGPELSERDLVPFFYAMTKDLDEVRVGMLSNLSTFIRILGKQARSNILDCLGTFLVTDNKNNWRFRLQLATQLIEVTNLIEPEDVYKHLCPLALHLSLDSIADVRIAAFELLACQVKRLNSDSSSSISDGEVVTSTQPLVKDFVAKIVETLAHNTKWVQRQGFARVSGNLILKDALKRDQFAQLIFPHLIKLREDKVPNVRLVVAQTITNYLIDWEYFTLPSSAEMAISHEIVLETLSKLRRDSDTDVRFYSGGVEESSVVLDETRTWETDMSIDSSGNENNVTFTMAPEDQATTSALSPPSPDH